MLRRLDGVLAQIRKTGRTGELRYSEEHILPKSAFPTASVGRQKTEQYTGPVNRCPLVAGAPAFARMHGPAL